MSRVRFAADLINGFAFESSDFVREESSSTIPLVRVRDVRGDKFETFIEHSKVSPQSLIRDGDVVIGMDGDFNSVLWSRGSAALNQRVCLIRVEDLELAKFISYVIPSELQAINEVSFFTTVKHLSSDQVLNLHLPEFGKDEMLSLVNYLDRETAEIDSMRAELDSIEALLVERRSSIVRTHLLPEDGAYTRIKLVADVSLGKTVQSEQKRSEEVQRNYVRAAHIQPHGQLVLDDQMMWFTRQELEQLTLCEGDVLVVEGGAGYGRSVVLDEDMPDWGFQNHVVRVRPSPKAIGQFVHFTILAHYSAGLIDTMAAGATIPALSSDKVRELPILSVDIDTQRRIAEEVKRDTSEIDSMLAEIKELRDLLAERRSALITAAVNGQIDIPATASATTKD